jgi:putative membrane protein
MNRTTSTLLSLGVSVVLIALGVWFLYSHNIGFWPENDRWQMGHHGIMGGGMGIIMIIFWILIVGAFVLIVSGAANGIRGTKLHQGDQPNSTEILKKRYANGEIDKAEYEEKRRVLLN